MIIAAYMITTFLLGGPEDIEIEIDINLQDLSPENLPSPPPDTWKTHVKRIINAVFLFYTLYVAIKARKAIRERNGIPTKNCGSLEDCCCVYFCGCCTISQMARQTADYDVCRKIF